MLTVGLTKNSLFWKAKTKKKVELKKDLQCKCHLYFMCQPVLKFHLWQMLISNGATLKLSYKAFLKDFKVKANFQSRLKSQKNAFYKIYQTSKILFGNLNNLFFFNSFEPQKCFFNMNLPFFWCLMSIMTHDAKQIQISSKTTIWVLRCKKEVRFSFHFFFQLNFFFFFCCLESWSTFELETKYKQPEKIKNMIL